MSLSLNVAQPSGVLATFWTLNCINLNAIAHLGTIKLDGYLDATSHAASCTPLTSTTISVVFVPTNVVPNISVMDAIYMKIQLDPFFTGATYTPDGL